MKVTVAKTLYETVDIDDKFASILEKSAKNEILDFTDEEEELWDELIGLATKNEWYTGYTVDKSNFYWEI